MVRVLEVRLDNMLIILSPVPASTLSEWAEALPLLQTLTIWSGDALAEHAGDKLRKHCPSFKQLRVYTWYAGIYASFPILTTSV